MNRKKGYIAGPISGDHDIALIGLAGAV